MIKPKMVESTQIVQSPIVLGRIEDSTCDFLSSEFVDINIKLQQGNCLINLKLFVVYNSNNKKF